MDTHEITLLLQQFSIMSSIIQLSYFVLFRHLKTMITQTENILYSWLTKLEKLKLTITHTSSAYFCTLFYIANKCMIQTFYHTALILEMHKLHII
jgi:hypothetical protein